MIMNRLSFFLLSAFMLMLCACDDNVQLFRDAALQLDNTRHTLTDEFDYWPDCGIRVTGSHLASLISLEGLQKLLPCPLFVSGPHDAENGVWDLENPEQFGHYNPKAIQYLADLAEKVVADAAFVKMSQGLVDEYLYDKMHVMMVLHDALYDEKLPDYMGYDARDSRYVREDIFKDLLASNGGGISAAPVFASCMNLSAPPRDYYPFWDLNHLYFWARRWSDGTIDLFYKALSTVFKAYYPTYDFNLDRYWQEPEYYDYEEDEA